MIYLLFPCAVIKLQLLLKSWSSSAELLSRFPRHQWQIKPAQPAGAAILLFKYISISISLPKHKLIPLPSTPQPNVFPIKAAVCGLQLQSWCADFWEAEPVFNSIWPLLRTQLLSECINISFNSCSRKSAPISLLEAMFYITPSFDEGFLSVLRFLKVKLLGVWSTKCIIQGSKSDFIMRCSQLTLCFVVFKRQGCTLDEIKGKWEKFTLWRSRKQMGKFTQIFHHSFVPSVSTAGFGWGIYGFELVFFFSNNPVPDKRVIPVCINNSLSNRCCLEPK